MIGEWYSIGTEGLVQPCKMLVCMQPTSQSQDTGALPVIRAATDPSLTGGGFKYFGPFYKGPINANIGNEGVVHLTILIVLWLSGTQCQELSAWSHPGTTDVVHKLTSSLANLHVALVAEVQHTAAVCLQRSCVITVWHIFILCTECDSNG